MDQLSSHPPPRGVGQSNQTISREILNLPNISRKINPAGEREKIFSSFYFSDWTRAIIIPHMSLAETRSWRSSPPASVQWSSWSSVGGRLGCRHRSTGTRGSWSVQVRGGWGWWGGWWRGWWGGWGGLGGDQLMSVCVLYCLCWSQSVLTGLVP